MLPARIRKRDPESELVIHVLCVAADCFAHRQRGGAERIRHFDRHVRCRRNASRNRATQAAARCSR